MLSRPQGRPCSSLRSDGKAFCKTATSCGHAHGIWRAEEQSQVRVRPAHHGADRHPSSAEWAALAAVSSQCRARTGCRLPVATRTTPKACRSSDKHALRDVKPECGVRVWADLNVAIGSSGRHEESEQRMQPRRGRYSKLLPFLNRQRSNEHHKSCTRMTLHSGAREKGHTHRDGQRLSLCRLSVRLRLARYFTPAPQESPDWSVGDAHP